MDAINEARLRVWSEQPPEFFEEAILDADGTLVGTDAECKEGVDIAYDGTWGYHPLLISLANTAEPLYLVNRSGNRPSHEQAAEYLDKAIDLCRRAGFRRITVRGDTDFTQTKHLDRWNSAGDINFVFGFDNNKALKARADELPAEAYGFLERPPRYEIKTVPRQQPERVKQQIVNQRGYKTIHVLQEMIAEFDYRRPPAGEVIGSSSSASGWESIRRNCGCSRSIAISSISPTTATLRPKISCSRPMTSATDLIAQLKSGVYALTTPVDTLVGNWAYMVMASLAWSLKAWRLLTPVSPRHAAKHETERRSLLRMEFPTFCRADSDAAPDRAVGR